MDAETTPPEPLVTRFKIGDKEIDIKGAFPFTLGDLRKLGRMKLLDKDGNVNLSDADTVAKVMLFVVQKIEKGITEEMLDGITLPDLKRLVFSFSTLMKQGMEVPKTDYPTSTPSSSSAVNSDGGQPISTS